MEVGVGLPTTTPGADGTGILEWARRADQGPFASLGVLDRMVYRSVEPFAALSAAAAVTTRARLVTMVVIGPLRNTALLAKQAASLDLLSAGRLTLGLAIGARTDDYRALGAPAQQIKTFPVLFGDADPGQLQQVADETGGEVFDGRSESLSKVFKEIRGFQ